MKIVSLIIGLFLIVISAFLYKASKSMEKRWDNFYKQSRGLIVGHPSPESWSTPFYLKLCSMVVLIIGALLLIVGV